MTNTDIEPVKVHLVADDTRGGPPPPPRPKIVSYRTVTLTAAQPVAVVAGDEPYRCGLIVQASGTNDVYLCDSEASALAVINAGPGGGADVGYLLPHANTAPTSWEDSGEIWAAAVTYPASLSVIIISREP